MKKILISGSREYNNLPLVRNLVDRLVELYGEYLLLNGKAWGVDQVAYYRAQELKIPIQFYIPKWDEFGRSAGHIRNRQMVNDADEVYCFWDGQSHGTKGVIDYAEEKGKLKAVFYNTLE